MSQTTPTDEPEPNPEEQRVTDWRLHKLLEMGVPREDAENLAARHDVDYRDLRKLLDGGCDVETALRIVA